MGGAKGLFERFIESVERFTGRSIEDIRETPICESRRQKEQKDKLQITSWFPLIGRGNVLRDRTLSRGEIEKKFEESLQK